MRLVLASSNKGKLAEFRQLLGGANVELIAQSDLGVEDADETGLSFIENALLKARHASAITGLPALADDSGICVDALGGAPGIHSARFAGEHGNAQANIDKLLIELDEVPDGARGAHFHCVLVLVRHANDPQPLIAEGEWRGTILRERRGSSGHGYDPVFFDVAHRQAAAEMPAELKNAISHRGKALAELKKKLVAVLGETHAAR